MNEWQSISEKSHEQVISARCAKKSFSILSKLHLEPNKGLMHMLDLNMISHLCLHAYGTSGHWECFQNFVHKEAGEHFRVRF